MTITSELAAGAQPNAFIAFDIRHPGVGRIGSFQTGGIRRADGEPTQGQVCIRECNGGFLHPIVAVVTTDQNGDWELRGLPLERRYRAEIRDPSRQLNGAVLDWIQPVLMD